MTKASKIIYFIISVIFFALFDTVCSDFVIKNINNLPQNKILDLIFIQNSGAAFSILENYKLLLIAFAIIAILGIFFYIIKHAKQVSTMTTFWFAMLAAGIFCNMYERIVFGYVRDFFKLNFVNFPVFNISDVFINVSVFVIVIMIINNEINNRRTNRWE